MPKINHEEYEILKNLDDKWKWMARDENGQLYKFLDKPRKINEFNWNDPVETWLRMNDDNFKFIQWEDEEPYSIDELIEEYEKDYKGSWEHAIEFSGEVFGESEEKEVKDIKWAKNEIKGLMTEESQSYPHDKMVEQEIVLGILNQLDEPETLSQEFIEEHQGEVLDEDEGIRFNAVGVEDLQNLLVPKQELPVIPQFVAEWIKEMKQEERPLYSIMSTLMNKTNHKWSVWKNANKNFSEIVAQAWLAYPNIEIEQEPRYYAKIKGHENIESNDKYWNYNTDMEELSIGDSEVHPNVISEYVLKATKDEWANLGITDDNAEFELVEEMEE